MGARPASPRRYLLDTHALLFVDQDPHRLPRRIAELIADARNDVFVSVATLWEIQIKCMTGKLKMPLPIDRMMLRQQRENDVTMLPIELAHLVEHEALARHHADPFDRMLIAQARAERLVLLSADAQIARYDVEVLW